MPINIELTSYSVKNLPTAITEAFNAAAAVWEGIIGNDFRLNVQVVETAIDGSHGTVGITTARLYLNTVASPSNPSMSNAVASYGYIKIDYADSQRLISEGKLEAVFIHEIAHLLGFGDKWDELGLTDGTSYTGAFALAAYRAMSGNPNATAVPLEAYGGDGTAYVHWREDIFNTEIMTGYAEDGGVAEQISILTLAALRDIGYTVDSTLAQPYALPPPPPIGPAQSLKGSKAADILEGGTGHDRLSGKKGDDGLYGNNGNDSLSGGKGADYADGGFGDDSIAGGKGDDRLFGDFGKDTIFGGKGSDLVVGEDGSDILYGGKGLDFLDGGTGNDSLVGGKGDDVFYFGPRFGHDYIADFKAGREEIRLDLSGFGTHSVVDTSSGALITVGTSTILVQGVSAALISGDILLV